MTSFLFLAGMAFVPLFGLALWRIPLVRELDLPARVSIAFAGGVLALSVVMYGYSLAGVQWTRTSLALPLLALIACGFMRRVDVSSASPVRFHDSRASLIGIAIIFLITLYGVATARETCADLYFFWGPKAVRFHRAGGIDFRFLTDDSYFLMHADYPPLLPILYAWGSLAARRFSWWGALLLTVVFFAATVFAFRGLARTRLGARAGDFAMLLAAVLSLGYAAGAAAGAADPPLLMFETIAVAALTFRGEERGAQALAALSLAAAAFTKVEGLVFAAVIVTAFAIVHRRIGSAIAIGLPAILLTGSWIAAFLRHEALDTYRPGRTMHPELLPAVVRDMARHAHYSSLHLPWLAALAPMPFGRNWRRAAFPLLAAGGVIASAIYFYVHASDPTFWIAASVERVLLTALMCLVVASAAANE